MTGVDLVSLVNVILSHRKRPRPLRIRKSLALVWLVSQSSSESDASSPASRMASDVYVDTVTVQPVGIGPANSMRILSHLQRSMRLSSPATMHWPLLVKAVGAGTVLTGQEALAEQSTALCWVQSSATQGSINLAQHP